MPQRSVTARVRQPAQTARGGVYLGSGWRLQLLPRVPPFPVLLAGAWSPASPARHPEGPVVVDEWIAGRKGGTANKNPGLPLPAPLVFHEVCGHGQGGQQGTDTLFGFLRRYEVGRGARLPCSQASPSPHLLCATG